MIVAATLLADRKAYSQCIAVEALLGMPIDRLYVNIQTGSETYEPMLELLQGGAKPFDIDRWTFNSSWWTEPQYNQDTARYHPICIARNMAVQYAWSIGADWLLFVDSDVKPYPGGLEKLLELNVPLSGGLVPGRGAHGNVNYIFNVRRQDGPLVYCSHGTMGYCLIRRDVFEILRFRYGPHPLPEHRHTYLAEDPCFCADAEVLLKTGDFLVHLDAKAAHYDDPNDPLTPENAVNGYVAI